MITMPSFSVRMFSQEVAERVVDCPHKLTGLHLIQPFDLGAEVAGHWRGHHLIHVGVAQQAQGRRCRFRLLLQYVRKAHDVAYAAGETVDILRAGATGAGGLGVEAGHAQFECRRKGAARRHGRGVPPQHGGAEHARCGQ